MFPIADEYKGQHLTPVVTYAILILNIIAFVFLLTLPQSEVARLFHDWGAVPDEISSGRRLHTVVTAMFLHGGWLHLGGNMLFLWVFGDNIEDVMGHVRFLAFYLLSGAAGTMSQVVLNPESTTPMVGASGAIAGVLAAYLLLFPRGKIRTVILLGWIPLIFLLPAWLQIGYWFVIQFIASFVLVVGVETAETNGGVAYLAHLGGFVTGGILIWLFRDPEAQRRQIEAHRGERAFQRVGGRR